MRHNHLQYTYSANGCVMRHRLTSLTTHGFSASVFTVLFLRKAFGMVTVNGTFVFQGPFVSFLGHGISKSLCGYFFNIYIINIIIITETF